MSLEFRPIHLPLGGLVLSLALTLPPPFPVETSPLALDLNVEPWAGPLVVPPQAARCLQYADEYESWSCAVAYMSDLRDPGICLALPPGQQERCFERFGAVSSEECALLPAVHGPYCMARLKANAEHLRSCRAAWEDACLGGILEQLSLYGACSALLNDPTAISGCELRRAELRAVWDREPPPPQATRPARRPAAARPPSKPRPRRDDKGPKHIPGWNAAD